MSIIQAILINAALVSCFSNLCWAQVQPDDTLIIGDLIRIKQKGKIYYCEGAFGGVSGIIKEKLKLDTIWDFGKTTEKDAIILSQEEKKYIQEQHEKNSSYSWPDSLFFNSERVSKDSVSDHLHKRRRVVTEQLDEAYKSKDKKRIEKMKRQRPWVSFFSKPIYIRDRTVCLIETANLCGNSCGDYETRFYKRENGQWRKWVRNTLEHGRVYVGIIMHTYSLNINASCYCSFIGFF